MFLKFKTCDWTCLFWSVFDNNSQKKWNSARVILYSFRIWRASVNMIKRSYCIWSTVRLSGKITLTFTLQNQDSKNHCMFKILEVWPILSYKISAASGQSIVPGSRYWLSNRQKSCYRDLCYADLFPVSTGVGNLFKYRYQ